ncbi:alpha-L-fucosidase [Horticoccus luteus]|uniref:alpha-L-fucosidase n=1 Tax=Horticoccus luteus TaxID=2862869 RepID=A0A8F9TUN7_9BACT|nr:alpha-L-fucosidase [Horticoccus luteus]QYM78613.1 alpha-L-fucosidase [Horticoccus luteus]
MNPSPLFSTKLFACLALALLANAVAAAPGSPAPVESSNATDARVAWFREAKFGLFIHWGLYAIPAGYWKGAKVNGVSEWLMKRAPVPVADYQKLAAQFDPQAFDPDAWAQLAVDAGMKYVVLTAKHHDGFAMFKSDVSAYNVVDATPFKRDIVKELAAACARHGLRFGVYYSQAQDWHEPGGMGNEWDFPPDAQKDSAGAFDRYLQQKAEPQMRELLTRYGPLALIWFDTPVRMKEGDRAQRFIDLVRTLQPGCLINGRLGGEGDYVSTRDNQIPDASSSKPWEVPATTNSSWGFKRDDHNWKSAGDLVFKLVDIASKGGNYLLNVGPDAHGVIPAAVQENLRAVGAWLKVNGTAVYGTQPSPFGEEYGELAQKLRNYENQPVFLPWRAWRCTARPGKLFFTLFELERASGHANFAFPAFKNRIKAIHLLSDPNQKFEVTTAPDGRRAFHPRTFGADSIADTYVVEIEGDAVQR